MRRISSAVPVGRIVVHEENRLRSYCVAEMVQKIKSIQQVFQPDVVCGQRARIVLGKARGQAANGADRIAIQRSVNENDLAGAVHAIQQQEAACATIENLRDSSAIMSIVVRNQAGEVFKAAMQAGDLAAADANLTAEWGFESLYGGRVRLFNPPDLRAMLNAESLTLIAERGVRVLADYLPPRISRRSEYARILDLERKLSSRPGYATVARYVHCLARCMENGA
jgi:hypothetical protein